MNRYFFHINYGELSRDVTGTELSSLTEAKASAVAMLGEMLRDEAAAFREKPDLTITVADENDLTLWAVTVMGQELPGVSVALPMSRNEP